MTSHPMKPEAGSSQAAAFLEVNSLKYFRNSLKKELNGHISILQEQHLPLKIEVSFKTR